MNADISWSLFIKFQLHHGADKEETGIGRVWGMEILYSDRILVIKWSWLSEFTTKSFFMCKMKKSSILCDLTLDKLSLQDINGAMSLVKYAEVSITEKIASILTIILILYEVNAWICGHVTLFPTD